MREKGCYSMIIKTDKKYSLKIQRIEVIVLIRLLKGSVK